MNQTVLRILVSTGLTLCAAVLLSSSSVNFGLVEENERTNLFGGDVCQQVANNCITSQSTCTDLTYGTTCELKVLLGMCAKCIKNNPSWQNCKSIADGTKSCCAYYNNMSPITCGSRYQGPPQNGQCPDAQCSIKGPACGQQIPNQVLGIDCPQ